MSKRHHIGLALYLALSLVLPLFNSSAQAGNAVTYLKSQTADPWITQALIAAGETNVGTDHLKSVTGTGATDYSKTILAIAAAGQDPAVFGNIDFIAKLKTFYNAGQFGDIALLNDDVWSVLALASCGEKDAPELGSAKKLLLDNQNDNGGWGYAVGVESDTNDTAAVIMALAELGVARNDPAVTAALDYLKIAQNADGGFGWTVGSLSDAGSDAWVIAALNKIAENANAWVKGGHDPIAHLKTLEDADGGFWWMAPGTTDFNNKAMTAYAVIALAGKSFPVAYYMPADEEDAVGYKLRIEGKDATICDIKVLGETAMDLVINAATSCGYTYKIEDTSYGRYLSRINEEAAAGLSGWLYLVNSASAAVGAADYRLNEGDAVLFYYGDWGWPPIKLSADKSAINSGLSLNIIVEYFNGNLWQPLGDARVMANQHEYKTDAAGKLALNLADGSYVLQAEKVGYVRSNRVKATVGNGISQSVGLKAEIVQGGLPDVLGDMLIFEINPVALDFGRLKPGETASGTISLNNPGTVGLSVTAAVSGDAVYENGMDLDLLPWQSYSTEITGGHSRQVKASLSIPGNYLGSGVKTGELIFWARPK